MISNVVNAVSGSGGFLELRSGNFVGGPVITNAVNAVSGNGCGGLAISLEFPCLV